MVEWSDENFIERVAERARELGLRMAELLERAGVSREVFYKTPVSGRRLDTIMKVADACGWTLREAMGFGDELSLDGMLKAYVGAQRVMAALPVVLRNDERLVEAMVYLYQEFQMRGADMPWSACESMLIRDWAGRRQDNPGDAANNTLGLLSPRAPETE